MSYLGSGPDSEVSLAYTDVRNGDGTTTVFTLSGTPASENMISVFVDSIYQAKSTYTWNGSSSITFSEAPPAATGNIEFVWIKSVAANGAVLTSEPNVFGAGQRVGVVALTDGATITPDFDLSNNFSVTLGGNRTLANPTNLAAGQAGQIVITQDGTGSRTLAFGSYWKFAGGTAPTLTTTAAAVDVLAYYVESSTRITAKLILDVK